MIAHNEKRSSRPETERVDAIEQSAELNILRFDLRDHGIAIRAVVVPHAVRAYIRDHGLYRPDADEEAAEA